MLIVHVHIDVKPEWVEAFVAATAENARNSLEEPGIARFDLLQALDDPTSFVLTEAYRSAEDAVKHKETDHFHTWVATVEPMMAGPRRAVRYANRVPDDAD